MDWNNYYEEYENRANNDDYEEEDNDWDTIAITFDAD